MVGHFPLKTVKAGSLLQHVGRVAYRATNLFYGKDGANRYDDPAKSYGVLYLAHDLNTALMESVFHKHNWQKSRRTITQSELNQRMVRLIGVKADLKLANLMAPNFMASGLGMNLTQLTRRAYSATQSISAQVYSHKRTDGHLFDGLIYPSRNNGPATCIALFDRAKAKVMVADDVDLSDHADWPGFKKKFEIIVLPK